jgi:RNA polymerase sigma-70 factor (ECF subfamily)
MVKLKDTKTDMDLITDTLNGNHTSFTTLVNRYYASLYWVIYRIVGNSTDADDLTSESLVKAYEKLSSYSNKYAFSTWLHTIGSNRAIDFVRNRNKRPSPINNPTSTEEDIMTPSIESDLSAEDNMIRLETNDIIANIISELKPFHRSLINMRYFKNMSYEEISKKLNKPIGTIKTGLFRARKILYNLIKDNKNLK